jgi:putative Ca2+/H+ antiporter (TMEM165/GDT1 family)
MACNLLAETSEWLDRTLPVIDWAAGWTPAVTSFALVAAAEFGDKSQLVCMTLAARHRPWPVLLGAVLAFAVLNLIAVVFGAAAAKWLPDGVISLGVAVLFGVFGVRSLLAKEDTAEAVEEKSGHGIFATAFLMLFLAEFGDKTQIAVAGLGAAAPPVPVWLGATLALGGTSAVGIWFGRRMLRKLRWRLIHLLSGLLFLGFAVFAAVRAVGSGEWSVWWGEVERWIRVLQ